MFSYNTPKWKYRISYRHLAVFFSCVYVLSLIPMLVLAFYDFPSADDFSMALQPHLYFVETGNFFGTIVESLKKSWLVYSQYEGYFFSIILTCICPSIFGEFWYFLTPFLILGMLTFGVLYFFDALFVRVFGLDKDLSTAAGMVTLILMIQCMPQGSIRTEAFYWYAGAINYSFTFGMAFFWLGLLMRSVYDDSEKSRRRKLIWATFWGFWMGGANYMTALELAICSVLILFILFMVKQGIFRFDAGSELNNVATAASGGNTAGQIGKTVKQAGNTAKQAGNVAKQAGNIAKQAGNTAKQAGNTVEQAGNTTKLVGNSGGTGNSAKSGMTEEIEPATGKRKSFNMIWIPTLVNLIGFACSCFTPGNLVRSAETEHIGAVKAVLLSIHSTFDMMADDMARWELVAALVLLVPVFWEMARSLRHKLEHPLMFTLFAFLLVSSNVVPPFFAVANIGAGRLKALAWMEFVVMLVLDVFYLTAWARQQLMSESAASWNISNQTVGVGIDNVSSKNASGRKFKSTSSMLIAASLAFLMFGSAIMAYPNMQYYCCTSALTDLVDGSAATYRAENAERLRILKDNSIKDAVLTEYSVHPELLFYIDVTDDTNEWINTATATYYYKDSVVLKKR
jgi:hypothetical protein